MSSERALEIPDGWASDALRVHIICDQLACHFLDWAGDVLARLVHGNKNSHFLLLRLAQQR